MGVADAEDEDVAAGFDLVEDQMGLDGVDSDGWGDFGASAGGFGVFGQEFEAAREQIVVVLGLGAAELSGSLDQDFDQIAFSLAGQSPAHAVTGPCACARPASGRPSTAR